MDFNLNYVSTGLGKPFVFQHGLGANLNQPQGLLSGLTNTRLISMDCRGHGKSPIKTDALPSFDNYADDVVSLLDHLKIEQAFFGGISMGAGISLNIALRYPQRIKGLLLVRPAWLDKPRPSNLEILLELAPYLNTPDGQHEFEQTAHFKQIRASLPNAAKSILGQFNRDQGEHTALVLNQMVKDAPFHQLASLNVIDKPCLIIVNHKDPLHPFEFGEVIQNLIPGSQLREVTSRYIDDAKHQEEVRELAGRFLYKDGKG